MSRQPIVLTVEAVSSAFSMRARNRRAPIAETLLRNPHRLMVATAEIADRAAAELICRRAVRLVKLYGAGLQTLGTDNAISTVLMSRAACGPTLSGATPTARMEL